MAKTRKPRVFRGPASHYAGPGETILEFSFPDGTGGLLALRAAPDAGHPAAHHRIEVYRVDGPTAVAVLLPREARALGRDQNARIVGGGKMRLREGR